MTEANNEVSYAIFQTIACDDFTDLINTLITTAQFPKRGIHSCFALSCKQIIRFSKPHLFTSIFIPLLF